MILLFRLHRFERPDPIEGTEESKVVTWTEPQLVGVFPDLDAVKDRIRSETTNEDVFVFQGGTSQPVNRFAVYEQTGDTDGDGFPDGFKFSELYTASQPEPQAPTVRKSKRA